MKNIFKSFIAVSVFTVTNFAVACNPGQGSGQCGYYDNSGYHNAPIGSSNGGRSYGENDIYARPRVIIVPNRYGAIARSDTGMVGAARNASSQIEANSVALENCRSFNSQPSTCKIVATTRNGCVAAATGKNKQGFYATAVAAATTEKITNKQAISTCKGNGLFECEILLSACSSIP